MEELDILKAKIALISGGWSDEKEISLTSGRACEVALRKAGFDNIDFIEVGKDDFATMLAQGDYDVAFIAMHGKYGEDGCIQGLLELLHIPYTFSGVMASAACADKDVAKLIYREADVPCPEGMVFESAEMITDQIASDIVAKLGLPLFVKPATNGSSYGITRVVDASQLQPAVELACKDGDKALVEQCIEGVEITVPVIGNDEVQALPIVEINTGADFYDLKVKYEPTHLHHIIPAQSLSEESYDLAQKLACRAHKALGCSGVSRSDFIVKADGTPVILETNSIPGMTSSSLLPDSARHFGIEFPSLCRRFIELALDKHNVSYR